MERFRGFLMVSFDFRLLFLLSSKSICTGAGMWKSARGGGAGLIFVFFLFYRIRLNFVIHAYLIIPDANFPTGRILLFHYIRN